MYLCVSQSSAFVTTRNLLKTLTNAHSEARITWAIDLLLFKGNLFDLQREVKEEQTARMTTVQTETVVRKTT